MRKVEALEVCICILESWYRWVMGLVWFCEKLESWELYVAWILDVVLEVMVQLYTDCWHVINLYLLMYWTKDSDVNLDQVTKAVVSLAYVVALDPLTTIMSGLWPIYKCCLIVGLFEALGYVFVYWCCTTSHHDHK